MALLRPDAVRHVLVENAGNLQRSRASIRTIRPMVGDGLLLSEGEGYWSLQRRTIAPALARRVLRTSPATSSNAPTRPSKPRGRR